MQWSLMLQHQLARNLVVEAGYVGNRGAWFPSQAGVCDLCLRPSDLLKVGIDVTTLAGQALLVSPIISPQAKAAGFGTPPYESCFR